MRHENMSFYVLFKEKSSKYILFDICKWNYKSANGGVECQNHIK